MYWSNLVSQDSCRHPSGLPHIPQGNNKAVLSTCFAPGPMIALERDKAGSKTDLIPVLMILAVCLGIFLPSPGLPVEHRHWTHTPLPSYCWPFMYSTKEGLSGRESPANAGDMDSIPDPGGSHIPRSSEAHAAPLLSLCSRAQEPQLRKPGHPRVQGIY